MQKLDGHWVAKRVGILEHYKSMTLSEIVLFDAYLLLANKQTWECWRTIKQLEEILPMKRQTIINAKKSLVKRGWITKINQTGVFIPKLYRYSDDMVQNGHQKVQNGNFLSSSENERKVHLADQKVQNGHRMVQNGHYKVPFGTPIIEDGIIIEDDTILLGPHQLPERPYLHLLKSIPDYPFDFEKDLSFIRDLLVDFPAVDLEKEIKDWKTWLLDKKLKGKINYRSRLRRWLTNSMKYMEGRKHEKQGHHRGQSEAHREKRGRKGFDLPSDFPIDAGEGHDEKDQGKARGHGAIKTR